ncbi:MAG: zinc ribbon domain-containing protein, partial [Deltaproteobacteria bacterium]|nr:zinc ribbon domain-containing protein [Deltaproteobacteria bacterium]
MCGHDSPPGSAFCLNCGSSLASVMAQTPPAPAGLPTICGVCRGENPPGMKFCRSCGSALSTTGMSPAMSGGAMGMGAPPMGPPPMGPPMMNPPSPSPMPMGPPMPMSPPMGPPMPMGQPMGQPIGGMPPPGPLPGKPPTPMMPVTLQAAGPPGAAGMLACPRCGTQTPMGFAYCQQCGLHMQALQPTDPGAGMRPHSPSAAPPFAPPPALNLPPNLASIDPQGATLAQESIRGGSIMPPGALPAPLGPP